MNFHSDDLEVIRSCCRDEGSFSRLQRLLAKQQFNFWQTGAVNPLQESDRRLFAEGPVIVFRWRNQDNWPVEFVSENVHQFGYQPQDFFDGKLLYGNIVHPDDLLQVEAKVQAGITAGQSLVEQDYRILGADGKVHWVYDCCGILRNAASEVIGFEGYVIDITDRKRSEAALRESEEKFSIAFRCSPTALSLTQLKPIEIARFIDVNDSFLRISGYQRHEVLGQTVQALNIWVDTDARLEMLKTLQEVGSVTNFEGAFRRKTGEMGIGLMSAEVIQLKGETCLLSVMIDITDRKQAQAALEQTEARNRAFLSAIPDLMFRIARDGTYLDCNADKENDFAIPREQMIGKKVQDILPPDLAAQRMHYVEKTLQTGEPQSFEYQLPHHGDLRDYEARVVVSGKDEVLAIMRDITDRKRTEAQLQANAERDRLLGQIALRIRRTLNLDLILKTTVEEVREFLKVDRVFIGQIDHQWQGKILAEATAAEKESILTWITNDLHLREIRALFAQGQVQAIDDTTTAPLSPMLAEYYANCQIRASLGVPISLEEQLSTVLVAQQCTTPRHWTEFEIELMAQLANQVAIAIHQAELYEEVNTLNTDLERQVQERTAQLQQNMQELQELNRLKDEFLHAVSHDLRTPVMGMLMVLRNLQNKAGDSATLPRTVLQRMVQSCDRQIKMINSLLEAHSAEVQGITLHCEPIHLSELVRTIFDDLEALFAENQAILRNQIATTLPPVKADPAQLRRVLENLLTNAIKHNPPGLEVVLNARLEGGMLRCSVTDNGIGMTPEECQTLFERYARGSRARRSTGIGLGLYVSRQIITAHGGAIGAISVPGAGATFWFTLPLSDD